MNERYPAPPAHRPGHGARAAQPERKERSPRAPQYVLPRVTARRAVGGADTGVGRVINFEGGNTVHILDTFSTGPYLDGTQPFARSQRVDRVREEATLLPPDANPSRSAVVDGTTAHLAEGDGWTLRAFAGTAAAGSRGRRDHRRAGPEHPRPGRPTGPRTSRSRTTRVEIGFWYWPGPRRPAPGPADRGPAVDRTSGATTPPRWPTRSTS